MKTLYIIRGVPGAGKTTLAKRLLVEGKVTRHFEADMFFEVDGEYIFDASKLCAAHSWCQNATKSAMSEGHSVVVANTFIKRKDMQFYIDAAAETGHFLEVITVDGGYKSVHGVPDEVVARMNRQFQH